jgi:hypothetical protein
VIPPNSILSRGGSSPLERREQGARAGGVDDDGDERGRAIDRRCRNGCSRDRAEQDEQVCLDGLQATYPVGAAPARVGDPASVRAR